jgi:hypothetical protein
MAFLKCKQYLFSAEEALHRRLEGVLQSAAVLYAVTAMWPRVKKTPAFEIIEKQLIRQEHLLVLAEADITSFTPLIQKLALLVLSGERVCLFCWVVNTTYRYLGLSTLFLLSTPLISMSFPSPEFSTLVIQ